MVSCSCAVLRRPTRHVEADGAADDAAATLSERAT